uniref:Uncharacterized protein n=1 Tax=Nelumbo nucifera TaxID=4432 RepID=A0A822ZAJ0_NELNU|nr:TPA_asm: hypothetical protein HUJ06_014379 [Nelumbo nucifera]
MKVNINEYMNNRIFEKTNKKWRGWGHGNSMPSSKKKQTRRCVCVWYLSIIFCPLIS